MDAQIGDARAVISSRGPATSVPSRRGHTPRADLAGEGVAVVAIGGSKIVTRAAEPFGSAGLGLRLARLCDASVDSDYRRGLERARLGDHVTRGRLVSHEFFVCVLDLADELIRALGADTAESVIDAALAPVTDEGVTGIASWR